MTAIAAVRQQGQSKNTDRGKSTAARYWNEWFCLRYGASSMKLPLTPQVVCQFVIDHAERLANPEDTSSDLVHMLPADIDAALVERGVKAKLGALSLATITQRVSLLGRLHRDARVDNPVRDDSVRDLLSDTRKAYANRQYAPKRVPALLDDALNLMLDVCETDISSASDATRLRGLRNYAMLRFAFNSGGRRRSEVADAQLERLTRDRDGNYHYRIGRTKTDQAGQRASGQSKPISGDAAEALTRWLEAARLTKAKGPIFRRISAKGEVGAKGIRPETVRNVVISLAARAGLEARGFSAHSIRAGFVTEAANAGISLPETIRLTGHKRLQSVEPYYDIAESKDSPAAGLAPRRSKARTR